MLPSNNGYILPSGEGESLWFLSVLATIKASSEQTTMLLLSRSRLSYQATNQHHTFITSRIRLFMCLKGR
jgi:hypothetical protein